MTSGNGTGGVKNVGDFSEIKFEVEGKIAVYSDLRTLCLSFLKTLSGKEMTQFRSDSQ